MFFRHRKKETNPVWAVLTGLVVVGIIIVLYAASLFGPVASSETTLHAFEVMRGDTPSAIGNRLESAHLVKSALAFRVVVKSEGLGDKIEAGIFELSPGETVSQIANSLTHGVTDVKITIPEGFRNEQISALLTAKLGLSPGDIASAMQGLSGQLFPDTYYVSRGTPAKDVVGLFHNTYLAKTEALQGVMNASGMSQTEVLTLASLIERETKGDAEKPIVAGILLKRIHADWPLQLDATIQYIKGTPTNWWPDTTLADRSAVSPYNTYLHTGLPPAPIANPGLSSIEAVLYPQSSPYWFYLHDAHGVIHYAATEKDQEANIAKYIGS